MQIMALNQFKWTEPSLRRYRPAILILTALAAGCTIYYVHESLWPKKPTTKQPQTLHRSNARRRRRSQIRQHANAPSEGAPTSLDFLFSEEDTRRTYGWYTFQRRAGDYTRIDLSRNVLNTNSNLSSEYDLREGELARFRAEISPIFLDLYFYHNFGPQALSESLRQRVILALEQDGFSQRDISYALDRQQNGHLRDVIQLFMQNQALQIRQFQDSVDYTQIVAGFHRIHQEVAEAANAEESDSEASWQGEDSEESSPKEGQNLLNMLFRIAEEQARREGYIHRGISCNGCNANPIKGVRYRCVNCMDYDLCEACEALQIHPKTHLFYKVRIPRSHLGHQPQQLRYPGKYTKCPRNLPRNVLRKFCEQTDYKQSEIEGFWEQFKCLAGADWLNDPHHFHVAIDHRAFEQLFMPTNSVRPSPPNLIYDRVFSFYDTDDNDLIGFEEFIMGLSSLHKKGAKQKWKRIFKGFDIDGDGLVDRKDFLRMFKAHYSLIKDMTTEAIAGLEDENDEDDTRELITSGRPLSSAFTHYIPTGHSLRINEGKAPDSFGDNVIFDYRGPINEECDENGDNEDVIAQHADEKVFGKEPMMQYRRNNVQVRVRRLYEDPWPPVAIQPQDIVEVAGKDQKPDQIEDDQVQRDIRKACHRRLAQVWQARHYVGWQAVRDRRNSSAFHLNNHWSIPLSKPSRCEDSEQSAALVGPTPSEAGCARLINSEEDYENFVNAFTELISSLKWPVSHSIEQFRQPLLMMAYKGWSGAEIIENLKCYSLNTPEIQGFVQNFLEMLDACTPPLPLQDEGEHPAPSRRSRSSSKVRFEDGLTTDDDGQDVRSVTSVSSRSIPVNERWGGYEIPEPEEDVGREVLYQVTQEALNEVIDPIFKMREDLWLEAQATKDKRQRYRAVMCANIAQPQKIVTELHSFLKHCRIKQNYPPKSNISSAGLERSEAQTFLDFVKLLDEGLLNQLTSEKCPKCKDSRIPIPARFCSKCSAVSLQWKQSCEESKNLHTEKCNVCMERNKSSLIRDGKFCIHCGTPSTSRRQEDERLWSILSGDPTSLKSSANSTMADFAKDLNDTSNPDDDQAEEARVTGEPCAAGKESPSLSLSNCSREEILPQTAINATANSIGEDQARLLNGNLDMEPGHTLDSTSSPSYPEAAIALHDSVQAFGEASISIEQEIAQKPLDDLLEESGYGIVDETPSTEECSPPTSSSHPSQPNSAPQPVSQPRHNRARPDPTLPQNRPNNVEETASPGHSGKSRSKASSRRSSKKMMERAPDKSTLKFWAALYILEAEDRERGGPGRLTEKEFLEIMLGERGKCLEFVGEWMNLTAF